MQLHTIAVLAAFLLVSVDAWGAKPIHNIENEAVPAMLDGSPRNLDQVRGAIINGCRQKGWTPLFDGEAQLKCSILVRGKHYAEVVIPFSQSEYSILYSDSRVLDYNPEKQRIHRNYNKWVILLSRTIQQQFEN